MKPKEFINHVLINEYKDIVDRHKYLSFTLIAIGIEFLGKCLLTSEQDWNKIKSEKAFNKGMELLINIDNRYKSLDLKDELRNGLAHTLLPKSKIDLCEVKSGNQHFGINKSGQTILLAEVFYHDFVIACQNVIKTNFAYSDKMNKGFLRTN